MSLTQQQMSSWLFGGYTVHSAGELLQCSRCQSMPKASCGTWKIRRSMHAWDWASCGVVYASGIDNLKSKGYECFHSFFLSFMHSFMHSLTHSYILNIQFLTWCLDRCLWIMCPSLQDCQKFTLTRAPGLHSLLWRTNSIPHRSQWSRRTTASWHWWCQYCKQSQGCRGSTWGYIRLVISFFSSWSCLLLGS